MRRLALGVLGLSLGCNQIFGLKDTRTWDAAVDAPPLVPRRTYLAWGIGQLQGDGQPDLMNIDYLGIGIEAARPEQPKIKVGPELDASGDASLSDAVYDPSMNGAEFPGSFDVPDNLLGRHWRMVYTMPGETLPHEVQWTVSSAYLVIPRLTRPDAPAVPPNSGYTITPVGGPQLVSPVVMTSGVWTWSPDLHYLNDSFLFDFSDAQPLTGPAGAPETAKGDWVLVSDWQTLDSTESSVAGWALTQVDLAANVHQAPATQPTWSSPAPSMIAIHSNGLSCNRLAAAQADFVGVTTCAARTSALEYGLLPAPALPAFSAPGAPLLLPLDVANEVKTSLTVVDTFATHLPHALYSKLVSTRTYLGATLESSLEVVTQDMSSALDYPAALTLHEQLTDETNQYMLKLDNDGNNTLTSSANPLLLKYTFEQNATADEVEITLYEIAGGTLTPIRQYLVPDAETTVRIDRSLLQSQHAYVFELVTHRGFPNTAQGDYRGVTYPFGQSTKFSGVFTVQ